MNKVLCKPCSFLNFVFVKSNPRKSDSPYVSQEILCIFGISVSITILQNPITSPSPESNRCPCFQNLSFSFPLCYSVLPLSLQTNLLNFVTFHLLNAFYMPPLYCYCRFHNNEYFLKSAMTLSMLQHSQYLVFCAQFLIL